MHEKPSRRWEQLGAEERATLLEEHGRYLDRLPPTCDMRIKVARLRDWLAQRGIEFSQDV